MEKFQEDLREFLGLVGVDNIKIYVIKPAVEEAIKQLEYSVSKLSAGHEDYEELAKKLNEALGFWKAVKVLIENV